MVYTNEANLRWDTKWQDAGPQVTSFLSFVSALKLLSGYQSQILRDSSNECLNTHRIYIQNVMMDTLKFVGKY